MIWLSLFKMLLELAVFAARRAEKNDLEKAVRDELELLHKQRADRAARARDDVLAGRVPDNTDDEHRRD